MTWKLIQEDLTALTDVDKAVIEALKKVDAAFEDEDEFREAITEALQGLKHPTKLRSLNDRETVAISVKVVKQLKKEQQENPPWNITGPTLEALKAEPEFGEKVLAGLQKIVSKQVDTKEALDTELTKALANVQVPEDQLTEKERTDIENRVVAQVKKRASAVDPKEPAETAKTPPKTATMFGASLSVEYGRKWGFEMTASSKVVAKIVAIPPPAAFLEAITAADARLRAPERDEDDE